MVSQSIFNIHIIVSNTAIRAEVEIKGINKYQQLLMEKEQYLLRGAINFGTLHGYQIGLSL